MGRKSLPTNLKVIQGTDRKHRINKDEPKPKSDNLVMPKGMSVKAVECWGEVSKNLKQAGILTNLDNHALMLYCEAYARWVDANDNLKLEGVVIIAKSGFPVQSPYLAIANKAFDQMTKLLTEFGMTPSSRSKVQVTDIKKKEDPWDDV